MDANDDVKGYKPYGELFSKLEVNLSAGTTYYVVVRNSHAFGELKTRFVVENMQQSTPASARVLPWGELVDTDLNGAPNRITSLYDVDYYRIELTERKQISIYLSQGEGTIEDSLGNIRGFFSIDSDMVFELDAGVYFLKIENDSIHSNNRDLAWKFQGFTYSLFANINEIIYVQDENSNQSNIYRLLLNQPIQTIETNQSFDATPDSEGVPKGAAKIPFEFGIEAEKYVVEVRI